jgi:hypothetical protein
MRTWLVSDDSGYNPVTYSCNTVKKLLAYKNHTMCSLPSQVTASFPRTLLHGGGSLKASETFQTSLGNKYEIHSLANSTLDRRRETFLEGSLV